MSELSMILGKEVILTPENERDIILVKVNKDKIVYSHFMISFNLTNHLEFNVNFQGVNLTEFSITADNQPDTSQIVETFIRSTSFAYDSLRDSVKKSPEKNYLRRAFDVEKIKITDFKINSKGGTAQFLLDFLNEPD